MKSSTFRAHARRAGAAIVATVLLVPAGGAALADSEYECNDDYSHCEWVEYPDPPEFEDLITDIRVSNMTLGKTGLSKMTVTVKFDDPGVWYEIDEDLSWVTLVSDVDPGVYGTFDLKETSPGVLTGVGRANNDLQTGKWWVDSMHVWIEYDDYEYSSYEESWVASFYVKRATTLTLNASPEPVKKGKKVTVKGTLKKLNPGKSYIHTDAKYSAYAGKKVKIYFDPKGSKPRVYMGSAKTNSKGVFSKKFTAKVDGTWSAEFAGTSHYVAKKSAGDFVDVR